MKNRFEEFLTLHKKPEPLLIGNVWSVQSANIFEKQGFQAIATSSASVAETFGYEDGEQMTFEEYLFVVERLARHASVPLSVDLESGYGNSPEAIAKNIRALHELGVCGVNLEDSNIADGKRSIGDARVFANKVAQLVKFLNKDRIKVFINIRCDAFLLSLPNALAEALSRIDLYQNTGANGLFFPCITDIEDIKKICQKSTLPVNVMCMPALPDFNELQRAGVKRISMGPFLSKKIYQELESVAGQIVKEKSFQSLFK
jgi:2-methylisocitrate lyase-like PEP mutase family enzyme